jgi:hypothetical protein
VEGVRARDAGQGAIGGEANAREAAVMSCPA